VSYSISAYGHIAQQEAAEGEDAQTPGQIEAELAVRLHEVLANPEYGCTSATLFGLFGPVNLLATAAAAPEPPPTT
jgi:hypothetical protein